MFESEAKSFTFWNEPRFDLEKLLPIASALTQIVEFEGYCRDDPRRDGKWLPYDRYDVGFWAYKEDAFFHLYPSLKALDLSKIFIPDMAQSEHYYLASGYPKVPSTCTRNGRLRR